MEKRKLKFKRILSLFLICCCVLTMNLNMVFAKEAESDRERVPFDDERVTYSEGWNNWKDEQMFSNTVGSSVTVRFHGTGFAILGQRAKNGPIATVEIDGVSEDVDFYHTSTTGEMNVYEKTGLEEKEHTAVITFTDRANPDVSSSFANLQIAVFAFEVLHGTTVEKQERIRIPFNDERVTYSAGWENWQDIQMFSNTVGSTATVKFNGTGFAILGGLAKNGPIATVDIDGAVEDVDFFRANGTGAEGNVYEKRGLEDKEHTAVITFTDRYNPSYGGGFAKMQIALYAFEELHYNDVRRTVTVQGGTADVTGALSGDTVKIKADEPKEGDRFVRWESEDVTVADEYAVSTSFVMPDKDVTVTAVFEKKRTEPMTFYVDSVDGDDAEKGNTEKTAWKTLSNLKGMEFIGGDRILLKAGSVFEDQSLTITGGGTKENPIIVDMYGTGKKPYIKSNGNNSVGFKFNGSVYNTSYGVHIKNASHVQVKNIEISNQGTKRKLAVGLCVEASGCGVMQGVYIDSVDIHDVNGTYLDKDQPNGGLYYVVTDASNNTRFDDIKIENCSVKRVSRTGISVGRTDSTNLWDGHGGRIPKEVLDAYGHTNVLIRNNYVEEAGGDGIVPMFSVKPVIEYNICNGASQNTRHTSMYNAGIWPWRCEDAVFQFNECYGTVINGDGQAYDCDFSRGTTYQYNYSHDNEGGFMLICQSESLESLIRYNVSQNDMDAIFLTSNPNNADIYNNTFYIGEGLNTRIVDGGGKATLKNNIFYNAGTVKNPSWGSGFSYENNLYYGFDGTPNDSRKIIADPMFVAADEGKTGVEGDSAIDTLSGYNLQADSPAIDKGVAIENNGGRDYEGKLLSEEKVDLGAFERIRPTSVSLDIIEREVKIGESFTLTAKVAPVDAVNQDVVWSSSDESIAVVEGGKVTAIAKGEAEITATTVEGDKSAICKVTVFEEMKEEVDKTLLAALIDYANKQKETEEFETVIPIVRNAFEKALTKAIEINDSAASTQREVDEAYDALLKKVHLLSFIKGDTTALQSLVDTTEGMKKELYTTNSWSAFETALAAARGVLADENAMQEEIDAARSALRSAIFGLRLIPDKDKLEELINGAEKVDTAEYTVKSAIAFATALANAKQVFADENATEAQVKAAEEKLEAAQKALVAKADIDNAEKKDNNDSNKIAGADKNIGTEKTTKQPKTGDASKTTVSIVMMLMAVITMSLFAGRKRR